MVKQSSTWRLALTLCFCLFFGTSLSSQAHIQDTVHNLSKFGPGNYKSTETDRICVFCHTPHNANPSVPLWNHKMADSYTASAGYEFYTSPSSDSPAPSRVLGSSKLCLSCHDGTIALGSLASGFNYLNTKMSSGCLSYIGCVLKDDHPISIEIPETDTEVHAPPAGSPVRLEQINGKKYIECRTCHDPHDNTYPPFLVMPQENEANDKGGQLCLVCHSKWGWDQSAHAISTELYTWDPRDVQNQTSPVTKSVARWACQACHDNHGGTQIPLMNESEEENCFRCHDGATFETVPDIRNEFYKTYTHPTTTISGVHFPQEELDDYQNVPLSERHAECADCHEPHGVQRGEYAAGPGAPASTLGTSGLSPQWSGPWTTPTFTYVEDVQYEYEICLKCHSSFSYGATPPPSPSRIAIEGEMAAPQTPIARDFNPENPSTHAVMGPSSNPSSNYGKFTGTDRDGNPWGWGSRLLCSDCHGNDSPTDPVQGPHGSDYYFILKAPYQRDYDFGRRTGDVGTENHLCFKCHDYEFYAGAGDPNYVSGFSGSRGTNYHVIEKHKRAGCQGCHSAVPHGWHRQGFLVKVGDPSPYGDGAKNMDLPVVAPGNYPCGRNIICHPQ